MDDSGEMSKQILHLGTSMECLLCSSYVNFLFKYLLKFVILQEN